MHNSSSFDVLFFVERLKNVPQNDSSFAVCLSPRQSLVYFRGSGDTDSSEGLLITSKPESFFLSLC